MVPGVLVGSQGHFREITKHLRGVSGGFSGLSGGIMGVSRLLRCISMGLRLYREDFRASQGVS